MEGEEEGRACPRQPYYSQLESGDEDHPLKMSSISTPGYRFPRRNAILPDELFPGIHHPQPPLTPHTRSPEARSPRGLED